MAWNGYRASKLDCGGLNNGYATPRAKQEWSIGSVVNVGFVREMEVIKKVNGSFVLWQPKTNRFYSFKPHIGICRHENLDDALCGI